MNKRLEDAITQLKSQSEERQREAAEILFDFLEQEDENIRLSPEQIAEIERCLSDGEPFADEAEVRKVFARLTK
jgi:transposase